MQVSIALRLDRFDHLRMTMTDVAHGKPRHQIEVSLTVAIRQVTTFRRNDVECERMRAGLREMGYEVLTEVGHCTAKKAGMR